MNEPIKMHSGCAGMTEEEYAERCRPWATEYDRMATIAAKALSGLRRSRAALNASEARREACCGGELLHRGYYCPSLIRDIVDSCDRGKLCDPAGRGTACLYFFDAQDRLIGVWQNGTMEYIRWEGNLSTGAVFGSHGIEALAECEYGADGRILRYSYLRYCCYCIHEFYTCGDDAMTVKRIRYQDAPHPQMTEDMWRFTVENGMLKDCITEIRCGMDLRDTPAEGRTVPVKIVRKI